MPKLAATCDNVHRPIILIQCMGDHYNVLPQQPLHVADSQMAAQQAGYAVPETPAFGASQWVEAKPCVMDKNSVHPAYVGAPPLKREKQSVRREEARKALKINFESHEFTHESLLSPLACQQQNETSMQ